MHSSRRARRLLAGAAIAGSLLVAASCGDDDDDSDTTSSAVTDDSTTGGEAAGETVEVTGVDYKFEGLPEKIDAGTTLTFHNDSEAEFHEMVVIRIPDSETRSVEELVALPEEESAAVFGDAEPATVIVALPGEDGNAVVGDGTITEPGRYAVVCFIPVGADPEKVAEAMQSESSGPPDLGDGPPHALQGMIAELVVE